MTETTRERIAEEADPPCEARRGRLAVQRRHGTMEAEWNVE
jgi:hypothetical protein